MATRNSKTSRAQRQDLPRTLWLASLGAVSLARKHSGDIVATLVTEGEQFRARSGKAARTLAKDLRRAANDARKQVKAYVDPIRRNALRSVRELESGLGERLSDVLGRVKLPSKAELRKLLGRGTAVRGRAKPARTRKAAVRSRRAA
jgi:poly(hydroxyalkanoate) granule-associated protein